MVKSREEYLRLTADLKKSHKPPLPCSDEAAHVPSPDAEFQKSLVIISCDKSIFNTNEGQSWKWASEDTPVIQLKTKGSGIMVSDFVDQHNGYLKLTDAEFVAARWADRHAVQSARVLLEYGVEREGCWTSEKFMANVKNAMKIAKIQIPCPIAHCVLDI